MAFFSLSVGWYGVPSALQKVRSNISLIRSTYLLNDSNVPPGLASSALKVPGSKFKEAMMKTGNS